MTDKIVERVFIASLDKMPIERYSERAVSADELILDKIQLYKLGQIVQATNPIKIDENSIIESEQFNEAYGIIAEALIGACIETKKQRVADKRMSADDPIPRSPYAIPLIIRKLCYYLVYKAYALTYGYNYNGVYDTLRFTGYQTRILSKIQQFAEEKGVIYGMTSFPVLSPRSFNKDKWCLHPMRNYYNHLLDKQYLYLDALYSQIQNYTPPTIDIDYSGKKDGEYGFMLSSLVAQIDYDTYIELYGGSGTGIMQIPSRPNTKEYINDLDERNVTFYKVVSDRYDEFIAKCESVKQEILNKSDKAVYAEGQKVFQERIDNRVKKNQSRNKYLRGITSLTEKQVRSILLKCDRKELSDTDKMFYDDITSEYIEEIKYCCGLHRKYKSYVDTIVITGKDELEVAYSFYFLHHFLFNSKSKDISGVQHAKVKAFLSEPDFNTRLSDYSKRMRPVIKLNTDAASIVRNNAFNNEFTFAYSDSPYISTKGYEGLPTFKLEDMKELVDSLLDFKGKWIFSCRSGVVKQKYSGLNNEEDSFEAYMHDSILDMSYVDADILYKYKTGKLGDDFITKTYGDKYLSWLQDREITDKQLQELKVKSSRNELSETFKLFMQGKEPLYVLFKRFKSAKATHTVAYNIASNKLMEIMITNIDFEIPDYKEYDAKDSYVFDKMGFLEFYTWATSQL